MRDMRHAVVFRSNRQVAIVNVARASVNPPAWHNRGPFQAATAVWHARQPRLPRDTTRWRLMAEHMEIQWPGVFDDHGRTALGLSRTLVKELAWFPYPVDLVFEEGKFRLNTGNVFPWENQTGPAPLAPSRRIRLRARPLHQRGQASLMITQRHVLTCSDR